MKLYLLFMCACAATMASAQAPVAWQSSLGGTDTEMAYAIDTATDGSVYAAGVIRSKTGSFTMQYPVAGNFLDYDAWLIKYNAAGQMLWERKYGGHASDEFDDIQATPDGGVLAAGSSMSTDGDISGLNIGGTDAIVVKYDAYGNVQWNKNYGSTLLDAVRKIVLMPDSSYVLLCYSNGHSDDFNTNKGLGDAWLVHIDTAGNILAKKNFGGSSEDNPWDLKRYDGNKWLFAGGTSSTNGDVLNPHGSKDCWVMNLDGAWNIIHKKCFGSTGSDEAFSCAVLQDGFLFAGNASSNNGDVSGIKGSIDGWMIKTDTALNLLWQHTYGGTAIDYIRSVSVTADDNVIVAAETFSNDGDVTNNYGLQDGWLLKVNTQNGDTMWTRIMGTAKGDYFKQVMAWNTDDYLIAGANTDYVPASFSFSNQFWVVTSKTSPVILPVKLLSFNGFAGPDGNTLQWTIVPDMGLHHFIIERSYDGHNFMAISKIDASQEENTYTFTDGDRKAPISYYRLSLVENGGGATFSSTLLLRSNAGNIISLSVFPTITSSVARVQITGSANDQVKLFVIDAAGKTISRHTQQVVDGSIWLDLDLHDAAPGMYFIQLVAGDRLLTQKLIRQ